MNTRASISVLIVMGGLAAACENSSAPQQTPRIHWSEQNWTAVQRDWFYHTSQGTRVLPYRWFLALQQPGVTISDEPALFRETSFLEKYGFLPDAKSHENPDGLPVGFVKDTSFVDPFTHEKQTVVGLTCAACHTGQIDYRGARIRIDGGPALIDPNRFERDIGIALIKTYKLPWRLKRFMNAVLGPDASTADQERLRRELKETIKAGFQEIKLATLRRIYPVEEGLGRTDALTRIGNFVFGIELDVSNLDIADAPVSFPHLWGSPWLDWVQYNGSVQQPMQRNIGEALGVRAPVNLKGPASELFRSSVDVPNLHRIESLLAGSAPFRGLRAPAWPEETLGKIDREKATRGRALYRQYCQRCHLPAVYSKEFESPAYWTAPNEHGQKYIKVSMVDLNEIGTDPNQAINFNERVADLEPLGLGIVTAAEALRIVTVKVAERAYKELELTPAEQAEWNGYRDPIVRAPLAYKARPLDGIWATAPYLHNGAVPNLYQLLLPGEQRDKAFYVGNREFDPAHVGYVTRSFEGGFELRTELAGNSNKGHEFSSGARGNGVIGPELTDRQRWDLIEYLKTL